MLNAKPIHFNDTLIMRDYEQEGAKRAKNHTEKGCYVDCTGGYVEE